MQHPPLASMAVGEVLYEAAYTADELAHACGVAAEWVQDRVEAGILQVDRSTGAWRVDSVTLVRARRIVQRDKTFDADPQLAALTTDLIEEVARLRRTLLALSV